MDYLFLVKFLYMYLYIRNAELITKKSFEDLTVLFRNCDDNMCLLLLKEKRIALTMVVVLVLCIFVLSFGSHCADGWSKD